MASTTEVDENVAPAYQDVRDDTTENNWAMFQYEGTKIFHVDSGVEYDDFLARLTGDIRAFGYVRMTTGDEMSKRTKFALITWVGPEVPPLQRARVSLDKSVLKETINSFAIELQASEIEELSQSNVLDEMAKAGGANYGVGTRKSVSGEQ